MSRVLHISNIAENTSAEEIVTEFGKICPVEVFRFHKEDTSMGFIKFGSKNDAVKALIECHNMMFKGRKLKVSFSKQQS